jgi:FkbM family methyltransferase
MGLLSSNHLGVIATVSAVAQRDTVLARVQAAYGRGGASEVIRRSRIWLARAVYPGELVVATRSKKRRAAKAVPSPAVLNAVDVTYEQAMAFWSRRRPTYEKLVSWVARYIEPDDLILDIGANTGYFSLVLGELTGLRGTIHLYEPVPHLAELCERTLRDAPFRSVVHAYGLAEENTRAEIFLSAHGNLGWNTLVAKRAQTEMTKIPIEIRVFDPRSIEKPPSFIKLDVEGAEHRVLQGMWQALESWSPRPAILCEIGWGTGHPDWAEDLAILSRLVDELGYRPEDNRGQPIELATVDKTTDVLFVPPGRQ